MLTDVTPCFSLNFSLESEKSLPSPGSSDARSLEMADQNINTQENNLENTISDEPSEIYQETESVNSIRYGKRKMENNNNTLFKKNKISEDFNRTIFFQPETKLDRYYIIKYKNSKVDETNGIGVQNALKEILGDEPRKILKNGLQSLLVETKNQSQNNKILKIQTLAEEEVSVSRHPTFNGSKGIVRSKMLSNASEAERFEHLKKYGVTECRRMKATIDGKLQEIDTYILTFSSEDRPTHIPTAYGLREEVKPYEERPRRCFKCQKFGHGGNSCKSELPICGICSEKGHTSKKDTPCNNPAKCPNCEEKHTAFDKNCPKYMAECEVLNTMNAEKIPRINAIQKVKNKIPAFAKYLTPNKKKQTEAEIPSNNKAKVTSHIFRNKRPLAGFLGQTSIFASPEETLTNNPTPFIFGNSNNPINTPSNEEINKENAKYMLNLTQFLEGSNILQPPPPPPVTEKASEMENQPTIDTKITNETLNQQDKLEANLQNKNAKDSHTITKDTTTKEQTKTATQINKHRQTSIPSITKSSEKPTSQFINSEVSFSSAVKNNEAPPKKKDTESPTPIKVPRMNSIPLRNATYSSALPSKTNSSSRSSSKSYSKNRTKSQEDINKDKPLKTVDKNLNQKNNIN